MLLHKLMGQFIMFGGAPWSYNGKILFVLLAGKNIYRVPDNIYCNLLKHNDNIFSQNIYVMNEGAEWFICLPLKPVDSSSTQGKNNDS